MGRRFKREGTYVYLWLIHIEVWQKTTKFCKALILQLKKKKIRVSDPDSTLPMQRSKQLQSGLWCLLLVDMGKVPSGYSTNPTEQVKARAHS